MIVGCYTLHLYCDFDHAPHAFDEFPHIYTHEHGGRCRTHARRAGWLLMPDGKAMCPKCRAVARDRRPLGDWRDRLHPPTQT